MKLNFWQWLGVVLLAVGVVVWVYERRTPPATPIPADPPATTQAR